ncbi:MAG: hypothetical protein LBO82_05690 [Synergistaceae bacterium]|nr:hypothetical protein [Synergistaceae bacterium]
MNFEVYRPDGLSPGWFVTFDGYPVAQVAPHHWVYGRVERPGTLVPADVAVGSVVPMDIPELARTAVSPRRGSACEAQAFRRIAFSGLDNMGVLDDSMAYTPIAWKSGEPGLRIWLGTRWYRVVPAGGQTTAQALRSQYAFIVRTLRKRNKPWTRSDTRDLADLAREWGYLWRGSVAFSALSRFRDGFGGGNDGGASGGTAPGGAEPGGTTTGGGEWDTGAAAGEGGGGGGWDTGGGGGNNNGGGGGWDK